jgi:hypothetical protein
MGVNALCAGLQITHYASSLADGLVKNVLMALTSLIAQLQLVSLD